MPVRIEVPPSEWRYVYPVKAIVEYMKKHGPEASRHDVTHWLSIIEDYVTQNMGKAATVARVMIDFERRFGFSDSSERDQVAKMVAAVVDQVSRIRWKEPEKLSQFIKMLRNLTIGIFNGYVDPVPLEASRNQG